EDRAYDLARKRRLPVVEIGKYRRVRLSAVQEFIAIHEAKRLDTPISVTLTSLHDRRRRPADKRATRSDAGRIREAGRGAQDNSRQVGDRGHGAAADLGETPADACGS